MFTQLFDSYASLLDNWYYFFIVLVAGIIGWILFGRGTFRRAAKFFLGTSLFSVAVVMTSMFFPFIGGKDYFFRISIELAAVFYLLWWAFEAKEGEAAAEIKEVWKKPIFLAASAFVLAFLLASFFAYDPAAAFWSNFERGEGAFQILHYYGLFLLSVLLFKKEEDWRRIFKVAAVAAFLMVAYGIAANFFLGNNFISPYQFSGPSDRETYLNLSWWQKLSTARFQGSLGNPAYVAPYLLFAIFYVLYLCVRSENIRKKVFFAASALFFLLFLFLSQTRATFVGLAFSIVAFLVYSAVAFAAWRKKILITLAIVVLLGANLIYFSNTDFVRSLPGGRIFNISLKTHELETRTWTWGSAFKGFLERPILGWGPENFSAVFDKYFDKRHFVPGANTETWFDRAHSVYFDYLAESGALGFLSYIGMYVALFWSFRKKDLTPNAGQENGSSSAEAKEKIIRGLILGLAVGYLVQNAAIFEVLPMYINLFLFMAFSNFYFYRNSAIPGVLLQKNK